MNKTNNTDTSLINIDKIRNKLRMANLLHELNRLEFGILAYVEANQIVDINMPMNEAIDIVLPLFYSCINESKKYLNINELNIIVGYNVMRFFEAVTFAAIMKKRKRKTNKK